MKRVFSMLAVVAVSVMMCSCWVRTTESGAGGEKAAAEASAGDDELAVTVVSDAVVDGVRVIKVEPCDIVCSTGITIRLKDDVIQEVTFDGGCPGNTQGVAVLCQGMTVTEAIEKLGGIKCATKPTSCPDQLARTLQLTLQQIN